MVRCGKHISDPIPWLQQTHLHQQLVTSQGWCLRVQLITAQTLSPWMREDARRCEAKGSHSFVFFLPAFICTEIMWFVLICLLSINRAEHWNPRGGMNTAGQRVHQVHPGTAMPPKHTNTRARVFGKQNCHSCLMWISGTATCVVWKWISPKILHSPCTRSI